MDGPRNLWDQRHPGSSLLQLLGGDPGYRHSNWSARGGGRRSPRSLLMVESVLEAREAPVGRVRRQWDVQQRGVGLELERSLRSLERWIGEF